jgi:hypothetical protein
MIIASWWFPGLITRSKSLGANTARFATSIAAFDLYSSPALFEIVASRRFGSIAYDDIVLYSRGSCAFCHASGHALVLQDIGTAFEGGDAALYMDRELVRRNLRFCQLRTDSSFDLSVGGRCSRDRLHSRRLGSRRTHVGRPNGRSGPDRQKDNSHFSHHLYSGASGLMFSKICAKVGFP